MNVLRIRNEMRNGKTIFDLPLRVTFYARVSTDKDEQINSLENQIQYYTELIKSKSAFCWTTSVPVALYRIPPIPERWIWYIPR